MGNQEAAADSGRVRRRGVGGGGRSVGPVLGRLVRAADPGRRGRRPDRAAGDGRLLRRFRPVRGQRAAADGQAVGDHSQTADQRGDVPGPDGHVDRQHEAGDAAARAAAAPVVRTAEERAAGQGGRTPLRRQQRHHAPRRFVAATDRVHGNFLRRSSARVVHRRRHLIDGPASCRPPMSWEVVHDVVFNHGYWVRGLTGSLRAHRYATVEYKFLRG